MTIEVPELALSMIQPMGTALVKGWKTIENRKWKPWPKIIGKLIAIHASAKYDDDYRLFVARCTAQNLYRGMIPESAIIGVARVIACVSKLSELQDTRDRAWFTGPYGWVIMDAREIDPIPCKGALALWRIPDDVRRTLAERLGAR